MDWELTDEEILKAANALDRAIGFHADYASEGQRKLAQAQAKKLVEWLEGQRLEPGYVTTWDGRLCIAIKKEDWEELRRQVGLE